MRNIFVFILITWLVSSASESAVGCKYQIYHRDVMIVENPVEADGSIRWDIDGLSEGYYKIRVRYYCEEGFYAGTQSDFTNFTIRKFYWPGQETPSFDSYEKGRILLK